MHDKPQGYLADVYLMLPTKVNIGVIIDIAIKPTSPPMKIIKAGSIIEVSPLMALATSFS